MARTWLDYMQACSTARQQELQQQGAADVAEPSKSDGTAGEEGQGLWACMAGGVFCKMATLRAATS